MTITNTNALHICLIAGEASGDNLGSTLMAALQEKLDSAVIFSGIGGTAMQKEGLKSLFPMEELSVMGIAEVVPRIPLLLRRIEQAASHIENSNPDIVITIDSPDFSFRVTKKLHERARAKPFMVHYVAPTVWAWRPERAKKVAELYDAVLCLYPFEPPYFEAEGMKAAFVGHPVMQNLNKDIRNIKELYDIKENNKVLGLLFGSRMGELNRIGPTLHKSINKIVQHTDNIHVIAPTLPHISKQVQNLLEDLPCKATLIDDPDLKWDCFAAMDAAIAVSGTVGLELAVADVPHVIGYKMNGLTWKIIKNKLDTKYAHLANILLDKPVVPEFIQKECMAGNIAKAANELLSSDVAVARQRKGFETLRTMLTDKAQKDPSEKAAHFIADLFTSGLSKKRKGAL